MKVNLCFPRRDYKLTTPIYNIWLQMRWRMKEINLIPKKVVLQYVLYNRQEFYIIIIISHNNNNTNIKVSNNLKKKLGKRGIFFFIVLFNFILSRVLSMRICEWVCPYFFCIRLILSYENINHFFFFNSGFFFYSSNCMGAGMCIIVSACVLL